MGNVACTLHHGLGKIWRSFWCARSFHLRVSHASTALSKHGVGVETLFCLVFWGRGRA